MCVCVCVCACSLNRVRLSDPVNGSSVFMEFSRQEYMSGLPFPTSGDLPDPEIETASLVSPALAGRFSTTGSPGECSG